jgi:hypothetical protein
MRSNRIKVIKAGTKDNSKKYAQYCALAITEHKDSNEDRLLSIMPSSLRRTIRISY